MPYETVQEKVVQEKRVRVCSRCRQPMADSSAGNNRRAYHTVGSLGTSLGGSILLGSVLGPVGAIGGAIAGSLAGAKASDKVCDAVESQTSKGDLCEACQAVAGNNPNSNNSNAQGQQHSDAGGHRLGSGEPVRREVAPADRFKEGAQAAGQKIGSGFNWMKQSVTTAIDNAKEKRGDNQRPPSSSGSGGHPGDTKSSESRVL